MTEASSQESLDEERAERSERRGFRPSIKETVSLWLHILKQQTPSGTASRRILANFMQQVQISTKQSICTVMLVDKKAHAAALLKSPAIQQNERQDNPVNYLAAAAAATTTTTTTTTTTATATAATTTNNNNINTCYCYCYCYCYCELLTANC